MNGGGRLRFFCVNFLIRDFWYTVSHGEMVQHRRAVQSGAELHASGDGAAAGCGAASAQGAVLRRPRAAAVWQDDGLSLARKRDEREGRGGGDLLFA